MPFVALLYVTKMFWELAGNNDDYEGLATTNSQPGSDCNLMVES